MTEQELIRKEVEPIASALIEQHGNKLYGKRLVLTGAQGLLGKYICATAQEINRLLARSLPAYVLGADGEITPMPFKVCYNPLSVVALDVAPPQWLNDFGVTFAVADVTSDRLPAIATDQPVDYVLHAAGIASPVLYKKEPLLTIQVAVDGSLTMLDLARRKNARYLFTSTSEIYQTPPDDQVPTPETYIGQLPTLTDRSPYDCSKAMSETLAYVYWKKYGVETSLVRIFNSFGIGLSEKDQRITARIASAMKNGKPLSVYGYDERSLPTRTYCPAADTVYGIFLTLLLGKPASVYNIGARGPEITVPELCKLVERVTGKPVPYSLVPPPDVYQAEPKRRCPDIRKAEKELGYSLVVPLESALADFFTWALEAYTGL